MPLSIEEKERVRYHLGYINAAQAPTIMAGTLQARSVQLMLEAMFSNLLVEAEPGIRRAICELDKIEDEQSAVRAMFGVKKVGGQEFDAIAALEALQDSYRQWSQRLADGMGVVVNPYSLKHRELATNGLSDTVIEPW